MAAVLHNSSRAPRRASKRICAHTTRCVVNACSQETIARISRPRNASGDHKETSHPLHKANPVSAQNQVNKVRAKANAEGQEASGAASAPAKAAGSGLAKGSSGKGEGSICPL